jgi:DnaJ-class molecular chaperone
MKIKYETVDEEKKMVICYNCNGTGKIMTPKIKWNSGPHICPVCKGSGQVPEEESRHHEACFKENQKYKRTHNKY